MTAGPLADGLVAFACFQYVSETCFMVAGPLANGLVTFASSQ